MVRSQKPNRIEEVLALLDHVEVSRRIGRKHDEARETFALREIVARDSAEFQKLVGEYVRHHVHLTSHEEPDEQAACGLGRELLRSGFPTGLLPDGYTAALATGLGQLGGNMPEVLNWLANALKMRAIRDHVDAVFHERIDVLSSKDREVLGNAIRARVEERLMLLGACWGEAARLTGSSEVIAVTRKALEMLLARRVRFQAG